MTTLAKQAFEERLEEILVQYPALRTPGILTTKDQDGLISPPTLVSVLDTPVSFANDRGILFFQIANNLIKVNLKANVAGVDPLERLPIINVHYDLAIVMLQEGQRGSFSHQAGHKKCSQSVTAFEKDRISALQKVMDHPKADAEVWGEYACWLHDNMDRLPDMIAAKEIERWYQKAVEAGNADAMNGLAILHYVAAEDYSPELETACDLWSKSAAKGNVHAAENLIEALLGDDDTMMPESIRQETIRVIWACAAYNPEAGLNNKMNERKLFEPSAPCLT